MSQWPMVPLGQILRRRKDEITLDDLTVYPRLTIRLNGKGIDIRDRVPGSEIGTKKQFIARKGQLVLSKIDARNGAFGILPPEGDLSIITGNFWAFDHEPDLVDTAYLEYFTKTKAFIELCVKASSGTTNRLYLQEDKFLLMEIPLPSLPEQRRLVERIDALAAKIEEAENLFEQTEHGLLELCRSIMRSQQDGQIQPTPMKELVRQREPDVSVQQDQTYHFAGIYCFGGGVFVGQRKTGMVFKYPRLTTLRTNNFVYPKLMAWEGALAVVPPNCDGLVVSTEYPVFEINQDKVLPEVLDVYFRTPSVWPALSGSSTGTNVRRRRLNPADFLQYKFPLPSKATQEKLRLIKNKADDAHASRELERKQLDAMLPAILDRAFRGEL
jgi:type I restriction enzyme S subunit